ncbi:thiopeptide-type bacteriocin biosynthesis protein [Aquimarina algiphila]|uniref:thiopeptide-type bacteriocin biosynthesis protein n=1 Tax=Aquimarina algiphila TaxID=2047982 RepID=UPI0024915CF7|nr:thiopeptide-type bacteriocin biosynthesis protein [Aquimarina algiphila]
MYKEQRYFFIGSEWLYYKLYMGSRISDMFLTQILTPITNQLIQHKIIDKWFFINYKDPDRHVRIRLRIIDIKNLNHVINILHKAIEPFINNKTINKVLIDTYKRELERYGFETIKESETIFFSNSKLITYIISHSKDDNERWLWGLKSIDTFLNAWDLNIKLKKDLFENLKNVFGQEMGVTTNINRQLSKKYRSNRDKVNEIMNKKYNIHFDAILQKYLAENQKIVIKILEKRKETKSRLLLSEVLESYIHMHCNRLFKSNHRLNEWVLYYFLHQYYRSKEAQSNTISPKKIMLQE